MENPDNVKRFLSIGTPYRGTPLAYAAFVLLNLGVIPHSAKQLKPDNDFVKALSDYFREHNPEFEKKVYCLRTYALNMTSLCLLNIHHWKIFAREQIMYMTTQWQARGT